ncbi:general substrate transporter [Annulohypoxylon maeteangense]|uniref:general substrate transporter n=1 Tax=Annulohypoxylon maeteangense TaxID=1927788 RepID=UPI002007C30E|nr:general substrate transporter [Annulohypoxylon maeteangense]KAI0885351.1 general substrate transporter [Annulohypoxylon maeteangense]
MENSAEAPLISHRDDDLDDESHSEFEDNEDVSVEWPAGRPGLFISLLTLSAGINDTGVISATLVSIGKSLSDRSLNSLDKSIITSCTSLFALIASPISSVLADHFGRKPVILLSDLLFVFGALVQAFSYKVWGMVLGRSIVGAAVGAASFVTPLYIAELAPPAHRGRLVTMNSMSVTLGQVVAYVIGWIFAEHGDPSIGWRWMVGLGALPAALQCIFLLFMPETPRWLVKAGKSMEAQRIIEKTLGSDVNKHLIVSVVKGIERELREEQGNAALATDGVKSGSWLKGWDELIRVPKNRRALIIACFLQGLQQFCGFNSLMYFSATIFTMLGFSIPTLTSLTVAATNFAFTVLALFLVDRIGRRRILLYSVPFMVVGLFLSAFGFSFVKLPSEGTNGNSSMPATTDSGSPTSSQNAAVVILVSIMTYVASYAIGLGNIPWMQSELFPLSVRSLGSGLATATNWTANFIIGLTFLPLLIYDRMDLLTPSVTFGLYGLICVVGWVGIWRIYPETAGLSLEEVTCLLENGWGVE